jgi:PmbA protein
MDHATKNGADQVAVSISNMREIQISYRNRQLDSVFIEESIAGTRHLTRDEYRSLPDPKYYPENLDTSLKIYDPYYDKIESSERVAMAAEIEASATAHNDRIISTTSSYSDTHHESVRIHSNGFQGETKSTLFRAGAEVTIAGKEDDRPSDWYYSAVRYHEDLPKPDVIGVNAAQRALQKIGQEKIASGRYDMIVENRAGSRLLYALLRPMEGRSLQQKNSFLEGMEGQKIASESFSMIDDPFVERGVGSRHFDGEGLAARRRVMIDRGILRNYFIDDYYGKKLAMEPTTGSPSNLVFEYGSRSLEEMIRDVTRGILINAFIGGNSNSTTGDFSYGIVGQLIENGEISRPVNEMNISGNTRDIWGRLVEMGNDPYPYAAWRRPSMRFEAVQFSGI